MVKKKTNLKIDWIDIRTGKTSQVTVYKENEKNYVKRKWGFMQINLNNIRNIYKQDNKQIKRLK